MRPLGVLTSLFACGLLAGLTVGLYNLPARAHEPHVCPEDFPDAPVIPGHIEQSVIVSGKLKFDPIVEAGRKLFVASFNVCDGQGRPATTGTGEKRVADQPEFIRTSAPDSNACAGCHNQPRAGGAGDFVANVFVLAQARDPVTESVSTDFSNERNTLGMFGAGAIEMLAREMSATLQVQAAPLPNGTHTLIAKGVHFEITKSGGGVVSSKGVDTDLIIKPFHQAGVVRSIREFTVNAFNHHHGMQPEERFDLNPAKGFDPDFDEDGVVREMTIGDITAATIYQAALAIPGRLLPANREDRRSINQGEQLFSQIGCASCHVPQMILNSQNFVEPNPHNPSGTFSDATLSFSFDLTKQGEKPRLEKAIGGGAIVRAYTDLKRHNLCDDPSTPNAIRFLCNEKLAQARPAQDGRPGTEFFITRKLWDVGNSAPYGHRGDLTTITDAILVHGGEARATRDAFVALSTQDQESIVKFLKTLQVLPEGSSLVVIEGRRP
jgi:mono/diheme cytochrome c family protein